jgi:predicted transcriptional regulator of viral defense system
MPGDRQELRHRLYRLAAAQSGYFTAAQALELGYSYQAQKYHADHANWQRVDRGIFRLPEWPVGPHDSLIRWVLWSRGRGVVSHDSAAAAYDIGVANPLKTHLTVAPGFRMHDAMVVLHVANLPKTDVTTFEGVTITTPLRTVLDIAESHHDNEFVVSVLLDAIDHAGVRPSQVERRLDEVSPRAMAVLRRGLDSKATSP